jgi:hypothetical protein
MKILHHRNTWKAALNYGEDYLQDMVLHGLRQIEDVESVDYPDSRVMYKSAWTSGEIERDKVYGKGFSVYGTLPDTNVDRTDVEDKIKNGYYDLILIGSFNHHQRDWGSPLPVLDELIFEHTPTNKIAIIDGEDHVTFTPYIENYRYFKRELVQPTRNALPISFAMPAEKIQTPVEKIRAVAPLIPANPYEDKSTYIYDNEQDYYTDYNRSLFGITYKKYGWDCLRHYEIIASRSVPWFKDIDNCPELTMTTLPKQLLKLINYEIGKFGPDAYLTGHRRDHYEEVRHGIFNHFEQYCTTAALAKYIIENTVMTN